MSKTGKRKPYKTYTKEFKLEEPGSGLAIKHILMEILIKGQHTKENAKFVFEVLKEAAETGGNREDIVKALRYLGRIAAEHTRPN